MIRISPTVRLSISVMLIAVSLVLIADLLRLVPDAQTLALETRKRACESLAVQLSIAASRGDMDLIKQTLAVYVERNGDVRSAAMRRASGDIFSETVDHAKYWQVSDDDRSTINHVRVPVFAGSERWGMVEVSFAPPYGGIIDWLRTSVWGLALFIGLGGIGAFYMVLRRALRELDPRGTIPQRIKSAFDALGEGVLILDDRGMIVLANTGFSVPSPPIARRFSMSDKSPAVSW